MKFIHYDPNIGEDTSKYAALYTELTSDPTNIEFSIRVENQEDAFGVRTWNALGDWNSIGYYILIDRGWFKYVKKAEDIEDTNDFVPIKQITPDDLYRIKMKLNWSNSSYDIYMYNILQLQNITFVGKNRSGNPISSARTFQAVAFTNANCRAAYLDEIFMAGSFLNKLSKSYPQNLLSNVARSGVAK